jgi:TRAP-type uncharacterized transport system substrate-binding protein
MSAGYVRFNAGIQRAKGFLEVASALYEGSLSERQVDATTGVVQNISPVGHQITISLMNESKEIRKNPVNLVLETGGFCASLHAVAERRLSVLWISSSIALTMAYRGTGPFEKPLPLRALAVFPSWDVLGFAVHEATGIKRLEEIKEKRVPLRLSARKVTDPPFTEQKTMFVISSVLNSVGTSLAEIREWGGQFQAVPRPSDQARRDAIMKGEVNAVFDEGVIHWGPGALAHGFRFLPVEGENLARLQEIGFQTATLTDARLPGLKEKIPSPNIGGFPMVVHVDMPDAVAYAICEAIERRKDAIPIDVEGGLDIAQLCGNEEEAPRNVPLHPGAERFYREKGYLKD